MKGGSDAGREPPRPWKGAHQHQHEQKAYEHEEEELRPFHVELHERAKERYDIVVEKKRVLGSP
jgi:hypothetical protein